MQSDRLLRGMHKVFSHDLPNQMVVLQSLLQLLDQEESPQLSDDGREYVRRLLNATKQASEMVRFLKEMGRLNSFPCKSETISLAVLARELQGELQHRHADRQFEFAWQWQAPALVGDARVYVQAIVELCAGLLHPHARRCRVSACSQQHGDMIELTFHLDEPGEPNFVTGRVGRTDSPRGSGLHQQRMEIVLARAWLALCGADVELMPSADGRTCFCIVAPQR